MPLDELEDFLVIFRSLELLDFSLPSEVCELLFCSDVDALSGAGLGHPLPSIVGGDGAVGSVLCGSSD